jgi:integrase
MSVKSAPLDEAVEAYFDDLQSERLAVGTIRLKRRALGALQEAAGRKNLSTRKLTVEHFRACLNSLANGASEEENAKRRLKGLAPRTGRSPRSMRTDRYTLGQFVDFLKERKWVAQGFNPLYRVTKSSRDKGNTAPEKIRQKRIVEEEEWGPLLETADARHPRSRMIVAFSFYHGPRPSELALYAVVASSPGPCGADSGPVESQAG